MPCRTPVAAGSRFHFVVSSLRIEGHTLPDNSLSPSIVDLIGSTPLLRLTRIHPRSDINVWAKLEGHNPGGSAKDRTAAALFADARRTGRLEGVEAIVESSSGNLGLALARHALLAGLEFHCVADPSMNRLTRKTMRALGAHIHVVPERDPDTGEWLAARRSLVAKLLAEIPRSMSFDQYSNPAAFAAHSEGTMREIVDALGAPPDFLFVAMSTTGTIGGCQRYLQSIRAGTQIIGVDAAGSVLFGGARARRSLPGFGAGVEPELAGLLDPIDVVRVAETDSVVASRFLARREGILPGASGGAVIHALGEMLPRIPSDSTVALILHDFGPAYIDTLYDDDWVASTIGLSPTDLETLVEQRIAACA